MISHEEALRLIEARVGLLEPEEVAIADLAGRTLAGDVVSPVASPPFDKAAMDGYAVRASDVRDLPAELEIVGECRAGSWREFDLGAGQCAAIATGASVPAAADMVVMVEHTTELPGGRVRIEKLSGPNICAAGEDIRVGQVVLHSGETLTPLRLGVAAATGHRTLSVRRRPGIALLCTGSEIVEPPETPANAQIYNSNGPILTSLLRPLAADLDYLGAIADRGPELENAFRSGLERDLFIITGGVSVGPYDLVPSVLESLGVENVFHNCATKPGKPILFGKRGKTSVFGLPGNPLSCFVVFNIVLRPAIAHMAGADVIPPLYKTGVMTHGFRNKPGRKTFAPCSVRAEDGVNRIQRLASHGSADIMGASAADGLLVIPRNAERIEAGQVVEFIECRQDT